MAIETILGKLEVENIEIELERNLLRLQKFKKSNPNYERAQNDFNGFLRDYRECLIQELVPVQLAEHKVRVYQNRYNRVIEGLGE